MAREAYQAMLAGLHKSVVDLGDRVVAHLDKGIRSLVEHDCALAGRLMAEDDIIDQETLRIERACTDILALQQPVATDLRLVVGSFKIAIDLERVGDLSDNLGDYCCAADTLDLISPEEIRTAGELARNMVADAVDAYRRRDAELAASVIERDKLVDERTASTMRSFVQALVVSERTGHERPEAERIASQAVPVLLSMRDLERVGDHAANIAARVLHILTGAADRV